MPVGLRLWTLSAAFGAAVSIVLAVLYINTQQTQDIANKDTVFVLLLVCNSIGTGLAGIALRAQANSFFLMPSVNMPNATNDIFNAPTNVLTALGFAALIPAGTYYFNALPWSDPKLNLLLCAFLFAVNLHIGFAIGGLINFWALSKQAIERLDLRVLNMTRPDLVAFMDTVSMTVIAAGAISSVSILSLLASNIQFSVAAVSFSIGAMCIVIGSYTLPLLPLVNRIRKLKTSEICKIEQQIDAVYSGKGDAAQLDILKTFRRDIKAIHAFPPNGKFSFVTAAGATFLSFLPTLISNIANLRNFLGL